MKRLFGTVLVLSGCYSWAFCSGMFSGLGARANSMGCAFIGVADDATAIYWNPAGLTQLDGSGADLGYSYSNTHTISNRSLKNGLSSDPYDGYFPAPKIYPTEPAQYNNKELLVGSGLPSAIGYTKIKDVSVACGFYVAGGGGGKWEDTVPAGVDSLYAKANGSDGFVIGNISAAKKISEKVVLGAGLNYIYSLDSADILKQYTKGAGSLMPSNYSVELTQDSSGNGLQFVLGGMYKPVEKVRVGLLYKSAVDLGISGTAKYSQSGLALLGHPDMAYQTTFTQDYPYPETYGVGASYDPVQKLTVAVSAQLVKYSELKDIITYADKTVFADQDASRNYQDVTQVFTGAEYRPSEKMSLRGGFQIDPSPAPQDQLTLLSTTIYSHTQLNLGVGYKFGAISADLSYTGSISNTPTTPDGTEFYFPGSSYRLFVGYMF